MKENKNLKSQKKLFDTSIDKTVFFTNYYKQNKVYI